MPKPLKQTAFIDAWWIPLGPTAAKLPELDLFLSPDERRRAARFRFPEHALRFRVCRAALRLVLARYVGQPPEKLDLVSDQHGKPRLRCNSSVRFNLSHAGGFALVAVAHGHEVGVDLETIRLDFPLEDTTRFFTVRELDRLLVSQTREAQVRDFFRLWTRKEAVLKAEGSGLTGDLSSLDISGCPLEPVRFPAEGYKWWRVQDLEVESGYAAALAAAPGDWEVRWFRV